MKSFVKKMIIIMAVFMVGTIALTALSIIADNPKAVVGMISIVCEAIMMRMFIKWYLEEKREERA